MEDQSKLGGEDSGARTKKSRGINGKGRRDYAKIRTGASLICDGRKALAASAADPGPTPLF